jgi:hypothetical protein
MSHINGSFPDAELSFLVLLDPAAFSEWPTIRKLFVNTSPLGRTILAHLIKRAYFALMRNCPTADVNIGPV